MNNYKKVQIKVDNTFIHNSAPETSDNLSVYNRAFAKLVNEGSSIGKVHPIYLTIGSTQYVLGVVTLNRGGSSSLFLELPQGTPFDHITFVKDLDKNNHHYTNLTQEGREKVMPLDALLLSNGTRYALTLLIGDKVFLKEASKEVTYPEVDINQLSRLEEAFVTSGELQGSSIMDVGSSKGILCLQVFLIPKGIDYSVINFYTTPLETYIPNLNLKLENGSKESNLIIQHPYQNNYMIGIKTLYLQKHTDKELLVVSTTLPKAHYSKIKINKK